MNEGRNMKRRNFIKGLGFGLGSLSFERVSASGSRMNRAPNIIYILADDLGYADLGCYGQKKIKTPNIDRLAAEGIKFSDHYAGNTVCAPSRCNLMTGKHPGHARIRWNHEHKPVGQAPLLESDLTVAELLQKAGYATGVFGKWGLGYPGSSGAPLNKGFDEFYGYNCQRNAHHYWVKELRHNDRVVKFDQKVYSHDLIAERALQFIRDHRREPFFLYIPFCIPHTKYEVPDTGIYKEEPWRAPMKIRAAMITRMDRDVGRVLELLSELGLDEDTILMFASDNGSHNKKNSLKFFNSNAIQGNKKLRGHKRSLYEGGLRVPFIARWPGKIAAGSRTDYISAFWDILPTCCELAGVKSPADTDGVSLVPVMMDAPDSIPEREYLYWEAPFHKGFQAVRLGRWKALKRKTKSQKPTLELYDLECDIEESTDLADQHPEIVERMNRIMKSEHEKSDMFKLLPGE